MTIDQMIAVLEAAKRGEPLQALDSFNPNRGWFDIEPPLGPPLRNFEQYALRAKPREPRVRYLLEFSDGETYDRVYQTRERAEEVASVRAGTSVIEFREVLP